MGSIGERIAALRLQRGLTQAELGEIIGESKQTIYKYEHGIIENIPLKNIEAIAMALRCPPVALTGWEEAQEVRRLTERQAHFIDLLAQVPPEKQDSLIAQLEGIVQFLLSQDRS